MFAFAESWVTTGPPLPPMSPTGETLYYLDKALAPPLRTDVRVCPQEHFRVPCRHSELTGRGPVHLQIQQCLIKYLHGDECKIYL